MKQNFSKHYKAALLAYLKQRPNKNAAGARGMGEAALAAGLRTLDFARLHEEILVTMALRGQSGGSRAGIIKQAGAFFAEAIMPADSVQRDAKDSRVRLNKVVELLSQRTVELAASNVELKLEISHRMIAEKALTKSERHSNQLLKQSDLLQEELRRLSRQVLLAQEEERKKISRELHDVIAQTLTGINLRLATLKKHASLNATGLERNIERTQRLVEKSVSLVHDFARELRPAVLDDLGLIPALLSFMKNFTAETGVRTHLTAFKEVEALDAMQRTALFRVAQEALNNVARHAKATCVEVRLQKSASDISMTVHDDGKSFSVERVLRAKGGKRLGLLGMRERLEMIGGQFEIASVPGKGTTIRAVIPKVKFGAPRVINSEIL